MTKLGPVPVPLKLVTELAGKSMGIKFALVRFDWVRPLCPRKLKASMDFLLSLKWGVEKLIYLCVSTSLSLGFAKCSVSEILSISLYFDSSFFNFFFQWIAVIYLKWMTVVVKCPYFGTCLPMLPAKRAFISAFFFHAENRFRNPRVTACAIVSDNTCIWNCWQHCNHPLIYNFAYFLGCASLCCAASKSVRLLWLKFLLCQFLCQGFFVCLLVLSIYFCAYKVSEAWQFHG